jgi:hypothetical protein
MSILGKKIKKKILNIFIKMDANLEGSNPKLQTIKYVNVLPENKVGNYKELNRVDYKPSPSTIPYFDGKQSYLHVEVQSDCSFAQGNSANPPTAAPPVCFPAHIGANALINRCLVRSSDNGVVLEDIEAYNMLNGIKNAYTNDSDVFKTLGRITGVAGRTPCEANQGIDNLAVNYFLPNGENATGNLVTGGGTSVEAQFALPIETGLFSAFSGQHHAVPNLDVPIHLQFFLEKANVALQVMSSRFHRNVTINGTACVEEVYQSPLTNHAAVKAGTEITLDTSVCETDLVVNDDAYVSNMCAFRVGQMLTDGTDHRVITAVEMNTGAGNNQIKITTDIAFSAGDGAINVKLADIARAYTINKIELKLLTTIPDPSTMKMIRSQMARGVSFSSVQLYKLSTASQLVNSVIEIPEALTRVMSLLAVPVQQDNLESKDIDNSYVYCRPDSNLPGGANNNNTTYQWQIQNTLIPNLSVETKGATNVKSDNSIYFNQVVMALRHLVDVKALADNPLCNKTTDVDIELPFFYPVSLSPVGQSFNIIDSAPQLRINNSGTGADITAKLYHVFAIHTRIMKSSEMGAEIQF